jgi:hypothetical protein
MDLPMSSGKGHPQRPLCEFYDKEIFEGHLRYRRGFEGFNGSRLWSRQGRDVPVYRIVVNGFNHAGGGCMSHRLQPSLSRSKDLEKVVIPSAAYRED